MDLFCLSRTVGINELQGVFSYTSSYSVGRAKLLNVQSAVFTIDGSCYTLDPRARSGLIMQMLNQENIYKNSVQVDEVLRSMYNPLHFFKGTI